jgi:uncharacterized protein YdeI (YjbR/CyaY-like superfamily)
MAKKGPPKATFFSGRELLREWFERNHDRAKEIWIGYYKAGSGREGVSYSEAVEEALCFGWIDGQVRSLDGTSYANRYTPRRPGSRWSRVNVTKVEQLLSAGRMRPAGLKAFRDRDPTSPAGYSFEDRPKQLSRTMIGEFRSNAEAWKFYQLQSPSYRRVATFWVMSARREETRERRLRTLIAVSIRGRRINLLSPGRADQGVE